MSQVMNIEYPDCWEEVTLAQLDMICRELLLKRSREELLTAIMIRLSGLRPIAIPGVCEGTLDARYWFKRGSATLLIPIRYFRDHCENLDFILSQIGIPADSPLPKINRKLYGVTFYAYYYADAFFVKYQQSQDNKDLDKALSFLVSGRKSATPNFALQFTIWWTGIRKYLQSEYPYVFEDGSGSDRTPAQTLLDLLSFLTDNKPHEEERLLQCDVHSVLNSLNNRIKEIRQNVN